ncbi:hypothetical protein GCM10022377_07060 [Zhihengliuella alba]|uniref:PDZ domain-containing protein n=1 Tax=Zhihengliuella alba TaxID=547018 RepID=A0ABP7CYA2_9MICC
MSDRHGTDPQDERPGHEGAGLPPRPETPPQAPGPEHREQPTAPLFGTGHGDSTANGRPGGPGPRPDGHDDTPYARTQEGESQGGEAPYGGSPYGVYGRPDDSEPAYYGMAPAGPTRRKRRFGAGVLVGGMVLAALVGGGAAVGADYLLDDGAGAVSTAGSQDSVVINNPENVTAVTAAAAKAAPSVVTIEAASNEGGGSGSGIVLDHEGHILTNTHVVTMGGATAEPVLTVQTADGRVLPAEIVGMDPMSDLAVIKIEADNLVPAELGSSGELNVGDAAIAIGAPLGLSGTVTDGIVSKLNRTISVQSSAVPEAPTEGEGRPEEQFKFPGQEQSSGAGSIYINVIQTDAAINHGNSGGALVDVNGEMIGINVAIASGSEGEQGGNIGVGFAIPIDYAKRIANDLIEHGTATHGLLGVSVQPQAALSGERPTSFSTGAVVREVVPDSPAAEAGLEVGDVITGVDDRRVDDSLSLTAVIREYAAGSKAEVKFLRDGQEQTAEVTVGESTGS